MEWSELVSITLVSTSTGVIMGGAIALITLKMVVKEIKKNDI